MSVLLLVEPVLFTGVVWLVEPVLLTGDVWLVELVLFRFARNSSMRVDVPLFLLASGYSSIIVIPPDVTLMIGAPSHGVDLSASFVVKSLPFALRSALGSFFVLSAKSQKSTITEP